MEGERGQHHLRQMLDDIYTCAAPSVTEKRRLATYVLRLVATGSEPLPSPPPTGTTHLDVVEQALLAVQQAGSMESKPSVSQAKQWLRQRGGEGMTCASRFGKLTKLRNSAAHPLIHEIVRDVARLSTMTSTPAKASMQVAEPEEEADAEDSEGMVANLQKDLVFAKEQLAASAAEVSQLRVLHSEQYGKLQEAYTNQGTLEKQNKAQADDLEQLKAKLMMREQAALTMDQKLEKMREHIIEIPVKARMVEHPEIHVNEVTRGAAGGLQEGDQGGHQEG